MLFFFSCCFFAGSKLTSTLHSDQGLYECFRSNLLLKQACVVIARQAPLSIGFSKQEYWSGLPFPPPGDLSDSGIEPGSPALQADFFFYRLSHQGKSITSGTAALINPSTSSLSWLISSVFLNSSFLSVYKHSQCFPILTTLRFPKPSFGLRPP